MTISDPEILKVEPASNRRDGFLYVRFAGWKSNARKTSGRGDRKFKRPDGGLITADVLNDIKIQLPSSGATRVVMRNERNPNRKMVHHLPTDTWINLKDYRGSAHDLERTSVIVDEERDYILPAIDRFLRRAASANHWGDRTGTTLALQVGSSAADGFVLDHPGGPSSDVTSNAGTAAGKTSTIPIDSWSRFAGISGIAGTTIHSADFLAVISTGTVGNPVTALWAEDTATPSSPTDWEDWQAKTKTTASVSVSDSLPQSDIAFGTVASITTIVQEIADSSYGDDIQIMWKDVSSPSPDDMYSCSGYDINPAGANKLDIDYTAPASGAKRLSNRRMAPILAG